MDKANKGERYYFLFRIKAIQRHMKKVNHKVPSHQNIFIKLILQNNKGQGIVKSASWISAEMVNNQIKCENYPLQFRLLYHEQQQENTLVFKALIKKGKKLSVKNDFIMQGMQSDSIDESFEEIGKCQINAGIYIDLFKQCRKSHFQEKTQISKHYNIQYDILVHKSREMLRDLIKGDSGEQNFVNAAFKKRPNQKKIRYVEISNDRQKSVKEQQFKNSLNKLKISALKKSGSKYIPVKMVYQDNSPNVSRHQYDKIVGRNSGRNSFVNRKGEKALEENDRTIGQIGQGSEAKDKNSKGNSDKTIEKSSQTERISGSNWLLNVFTLLGFIITMFIVYEMMIPSKKI